VKRMLPASWKESRIQCSALQLIPMVEMTEIVENINMFKI
jgi:hypothetical protein